MSPRPYDRTLRQAASEEARRRIVEATAGLHAEHGGLGTSHAMIARKAGVSIPTVYKYFPTRNDLIPACTGWVASRAPVALDEDLFRGLRRVPERVRALAGRVFRLHEYFAPWMRRSDADAAALPGLRAFLDGARKQRRTLVRQALGPGRAPGTLVLLADVLLDFPSWRALTEGGTRTDRAAALAADAIVRLYSNSKEKP